MIIEESNSLFLHKTGHFEKNNTYHADCLSTLKRSYEMLLQNILIVRQVIFHVDSPKNIAKMSKAHVAPAVATTG